ncbi:Thiamine biosynthesis lipoprotein ApbE precursor [Polystyrenella longa]|uniref:FAD:protein FMN transferase n=1 Tax=Polystyrenella longa TaxID=2528007 RepID=A0A518CSE7_9PLAN|nr:FAD:protein FMN transferase [Polystyrenella longa]QDU82140.1 Thiamine biosynthesis lipoprotein ApbE precursor [Polystyrenella longa]
MMHHLYSHILRHIQVAIFLLVLAAGGGKLWGEELQKYEFSQVHMGVPLHISVYVDNEALANKATTAAYLRVQELDQLLSDYKIDSELNQLSLKKTHQVAHEVSEDLFCVLTTARQVSEESGGTFDVSVGPVVKLWRKARRHKELPNQDELHKRLEIVDYSAINLNKEAQSVTLEKQGMRLDLGGIAKGYAADEALEVLNAHGIRRALLDFGGDIVVGDPPPGKEYWTVAVAPLKKSTGEEEFQFIDIRNGAVATSGDAYQYVEIDGVRYSHIVDPRTGIGLTDRSSVTVIAPSGMLSDAWASAVSVLGSVEGSRMLNEKENLDGFIITEDATVASSGWKEYLHPQSKPISSPSE